MDRYLYLIKDRCIFDKKKEMTISINEAVRRMNLMNSRISKQQERLKDLQQVILDETGMKFWI